MVTTNEVKRNLTRGDALAAVVVLQVGWSLITSTASARLMRFGASLGEYLREIARFVTYNTDDMPFPFSDWPEPREEDEA